MRSIISFLMQEKEIILVDIVYAKNIAEKLGCSVQPIYSYCSNMVIYNTGISTLMISSNFGISLEELDQKLVEANEVFLEQARKERKNM